MFQAVAPVTIGHSIRCNLSIPVDGVPSEHVLFAVDQGQLVLRVPDKAMGRIAQGGSIETELHGSIPLAPGARGRLQLGEATILFQEIATPPKTPRVQLPASVRGSLADRVDRKLALIVSGSILAHCALATWAWMMDIETLGISEKQPDVAYQQAIYTITAPDFPDEPGEPGAATPVTPNQTPTPIVSKPSRPSVNRPPGMPTRADAEYLAKILAGNGETGRVPDMHGRRPGAELGKQIDHIRDTHGTVGNNDGGFRPEGEVRPGTADGPLIDNPNEVTQTKKDDKEKPSGRIDIKVPKKAPDTTTLTVDTVLAKIKSNYMPGLQRCYKAGLAGDSTLGGTVDITFTVGENGAVQDPSAGGVTNQVDTCIAGQMASWRFPIPKDNQGKPDEASFQVALALYAN